MARVLSVLALVAVFVVAAYAQQQVQCTYNLPNFSSRNRFVGAMPGAPNGGNVVAPVSSTATSVVNRATSPGNGCWQLDGFGSIAPALESGELASPTSPFIQSPRTGSSQVVTSTTVCSTNKAIYGDVREVALVTTPNSCSVTAVVEGRASDGGQGRLAIGSDAGCDYVAQYRLDGDGACGTNTITQSFSLSAKAGRSLSSLGDTFEVTIGADGGSVPTVPVTIQVFGASASEVATIVFNIEKDTNALNTARNYIIPFTNFNGPQSAFSNTGAIQISFGGPDIDALLVFLDVVAAPVTNVGANVFVDCGCNGFQQGTGDSLQSGVAVSLAVSGSGCTAATQTQTTGANGAVQFTGLQSGCTYQLSVAGQNLCSNSPSSQSVAAGGTASFAIQGATGGFTIPADRQVTCGGDTSVAATGNAVSTGGACGGSATPTFTDVVTPSVCSAPGGTLSTIKRTFTSGGISQTQTITVVDGRSITLSGVPTGSTLTCNQAVPTAQVTGVACTAVTVTPTTSNSAGTCDTTTCTQSSSVTVTYTGVDVCKNTVSRVVTYQRTGCAPSCPPPTVIPSPPNTPPPPPATQLPTNANCRFICDDDDSSAVTMIASVVVAVVLALAAAF